MTKSGEERVIEFQLEGEEFEFRTNWGIKPDQEIQLRISIVAFDEKFQVLVNESLSKSFFRRVQNFKEITFLQKYQEEGKIELLQLNVLKTAGGFFYNKLINNQTNECNRTCNIFSNISNEHIKCMDCGNVGVLDTWNEKCVEYCPYGLKNAQNICINCREESCPELEKKFFEVEKIEPDVFEIKIKKPSTDSKFEANDIYDVQFEGMRQGNGFTIEIAKNQSTNALIYKIKFDDQYKNKDGHFVFTLKSKQLGFYSTERNQIPQQVLKFSRFSMDNKPESEMFFSIPNK